MRGWARTALTATGVLALAGGLLAAGTALGAPDVPEQRAPSTALPAAPVLDPLSKSIADLQAQLARVPGRSSSWAELGLAYVQQARLSADPSYYGRAEKAFDRSLREQPTGNAPALTGQATLAAARHDFADAVALTDRSLALNDYNPTAWAVRTDALNELGRYDEAAVAVQRLVDLRPGGVDALARASYAVELRGDVARARELLTQAAAAATTPADIAFAQYYLGELSFNSGDLAGARAGYETGLDADPNYVQLLAGRAKALAATGDGTAAAAEYREVVQRLPTAEYLLAYGELLEATGQQAAAQEQYAVLRATAKLYQQNGQDVDTELALFEADHGTPAAAVAAATKAYARRPDAILTQEAYAWALHSAGRDAEALPVARASVRLGLKSPALYYRLGVIEAAAGDPAKTRAALTTALDLNPHFSPLYAPRAAALLGTLSS